jgi:hypothetical protein
MTDETADHAKRLRDLEAFAFRIGHTIPGNDDDLKATPAQQRDTDSGDTNVKTIKWRLDAIERRLSDIARTQGADAPDTDPTATAD